MHIGGTPLHANYASLACSHGDALPAAHEKPQVANTLAHALLAQTGRST